MRMIRCRNCGTMVSTTSIMEERIMDEILEERNLAIKDRKNVSIHLQNAKMMNKYLMQIQHLNAQIEQRRTTVESEKHHLVHYLLDNNILSEEKIHELEEEARVIACEQIRKDEESIKRQYEGYARYTGNMTMNRTKSDPTAKMAIKNM